MKDYKSFCSVALVQAAPVMFDKAAKSRMEFDPCGHYSRPDVLRFEFADI